MPLQFTDPVAEQPNSRWGAAARFDFDNPSKWVTEESVPLLDEHQMTNDSGEVIADVDRLALEEIARNNNKRVLETGDPATLILGHTSDNPNAPEKPIKGFVVNYKVKPYRRDEFGRIIYAVHGDYKVRPRHANVLEDFPRRSVELWWNKKELDPIALLGGTTPERDLGVVIRHARFKHIGLLGGTTPDRDLGHTVRFSRRGSSVIERYDMNDVKKYKAEHSKKWVSEEISHLVKDKGYPQKRAIAAALNQAEMSDKTKKHKYAEEESEMPAIPSRYAMDEPDPTDIGLDDSSMDDTDTESGMGSDSDDFGGGGNDIGDDQTDADPMVQKVFQSRQWKELSSKLDMILQALQGGEEGGPGGPPPGGGDDSLMGPEGPGAGPGGPPPGPGGPPPGPGGPPPGPGGPPPGPGGPPPGEEDDGMQGMYPEEEERRQHGDTPVQFSGTGFPGPGSTSIPSFGGKRPMPATTGKRYQRPGSKAPQNGSASVNNNEMIRMQKHLKELTLKLARADAEKQISALESEGVIFGDTPDENARGRAEETEFLALLEDADREQQVGVIRSRYKRKKADPANPAYPGVARYARTDSGSTNAADEYDPETPEQANEFANLLSIKKMSRAEAVKFMRSKR